MARTAERGLSYISIDVDIFSDRKIRRLRRMVDDTAPFVYITLLLYIGKDGYYVPYDDDSVLDIADMGGFSEDYVRRALDACANVELLSAELFAEGILTSAGIQRQYERICRQSKRLSRVDKYSLISSEEMQDNPANEGISSEEMQQRKEKKSKEDSFSPLPPFPAEAVTGEEEKEEKEKAICFFTFQRNFREPCAEYEKMVAFNSLPTVEHKWAAMTEEEKRAILTLWQQKPERPSRFGAMFLVLWQTLYDKLHDIATYEQRMAMFDDKFAYTIDGGVLKLKCQRCLYELLEQNMDLIKTYIQKFQSANRCVKLKYDIY